MSLTLLIGIPLSGIGLFYAITFNSLCVLSFISHLRAAFGDPGIIPKNSVSSKYICNLMHIETFRIYG